MITTEHDEALFRAAGFSFEYPGFWNRDAGGQCCTVSDGPESDGVWRVQLSTDDGEALSDHDAASASDAIQWAEANQARTTK